MLALISAALALMCAVLAAAWTREHRAATFWRDAAELDFEPNGGRR